MRLEDVCSRFSTGPFGSALHKSDYGEAGIPLVNPINIKNGNIDESAIKRVKVDKAKELFRYNLIEKDIIISRRGDLSKCAIITSQHGTMLCGTGSFFFHLLQVDESYFKIVYSSRFCQDYLSSESVGGTMDNLNQNLLGNFYFPLPPLLEQKRIVNIISKFNQSFDNIIKNKNNLVDIITSTKSKILELAMQGKLVPQDPADEPAADMLRRVNPKARIISDTPHYPQLPDNWVLVVLEDIVDYEQPQPFIVSNTNYSDKFETPVLTAGKSFILGYTDEDFGIYKNCPVIIFDDFTTDSRLVDFPFKVKSSAMKILSVRKGINIEYVAAYMSITRLAGETHKRYWISEYSKILIPIPPKEEQDRIISTISRINEILVSIESHLN